MITDHGEKAEIFSAFLEHKPGSHLPWLSVISRENGDL